MNNKIPVILGSPEISENSLHIVHHILVQILVAAQDITNPSLH